MTLTMRTLLNFFAKQVRAAWFYNSDGTVQLFDLSLEVCVKFFDHCSLAFCLCKAQGVPHVRMFPLQ